MMIFHWAKKRQGSKTEPAILRNLEQRQWDGIMVTPQRQKMAAARRAVGRNVDVAVDCPVEVKDISSYSAC